MRRAPRNPQQAILSGEFFRQIALYGGLITASTLAVFLWALAYAPAQSATMSFMTLALAQILHLGNARSERPVLNSAGVFANRYAIGAVIVSVALLVLPVYIPPLAALLHITRLGARQWFIVVALSSSTAIVGQALKHANRPRH